MAFCLDCPGRVVETLSGPPRARVSHGSFGTFLWNPAAITRAVSTVEPLAFEEHHGPIVVGDEVLLRASQEQALPLQVGHGGWSPRMAQCLGRYGRVASINNRGDVRLETPGCGVFLWNPAVIEPIGQGCVATLCAQALSRLDDEGAAVLLLVCLSETHGVEAIQDVQAAFQGVGDAQGAPPALRAFCALALLAAALDVRSAFQQDLFGEVPPAIPSVSLAECVPPHILARLMDLPAMQWPAADTGGVAFSDVVRGRADAAVAAQHWALAFFSERHRRLLSPRRRARAV